MFTAINLNPEPELAVSCTPDLSRDSEREILQSRILIVDDESLNIDVFRRYLGIGGYSNVISTDHAGQALPLMGLHRPDVVLLDIHMPGINGMEILKAVRSDAALARTPSTAATSNRRTLPRGRNSGGGPFVGSTTA